MNKVYLKGVYKKNLGDDLLIKILCDRYKKTDFYLINHRNGSKKSICKNLHLINIKEKIYKIINNSFAKIKLINPIERSLIKFSDNVIILGGSLFMERKNFKNDKKIFNSYWYKKIKKDYYIIGSNIGPVFTSEYIDKIKKDIFLNAKDICLRDKKSYKYIKDQKNARLGADIVFSLNTETLVKNKEQKKVIISVIDINKKAKQIVNPNLEKYENTIHNLIEYFVKKEYKIELISFCKFEGDEEAIERIICNNRWKNKIKKYYYDGNINDALNELSTAEIIIGTRFHANVIGMILNKKIIPIIYNDKTRELLHDIDFKGVQIDIDKIDEFDIKELTEKKLNYKIDINSYKKESEKHFEKIDKILQ